MTLAPMAVNISMMLVMPVQTMKLSGRSMIGWRNRQSSLLKKALTLLKNTSIILKPGMTIKSWPTQSSLSTSKAILNMKSISLTMSGSWPMSTRKSGSQMITLRMPEIWWCHACSANLSASWRKRSTLLSVSIKLTPPRKIWSSWSILPMTLKLWIWWTSCRKTSSGYLTPQQSPSSWNTLLSVSKRMPLPTASAFQSFSTVLLNYLTDAQEMALLLRAALMTSSSNTLTIGGTQAPALTTSMLPVLLRSESNLP